MEKKFNKKFKVFTDKPAGKPISHKSVCAECGKDCEVPFKPNGKKPVLCSKCFNKDGTAYAHKPWEKGADSAEGKLMFPAVCNRCNDKCDVPFKPEAGRPIYCAKCLGHSDKTSIKDIEQFNQQFAAINSKLDAILKALAS